MKLVYFALLFFVCICASQKIGNVIYITRWHYAGVCDNTTAMTIKGSSKLYQTFEVWNGVVNVTKDIICEKVIFTMQKCGQNFYPCEKFVTFKIDKNLRDFLLSKTMGWRLLWESVHPQPKWPIIHKGIYTVTNATLDVNLMVAMIPEFADYCWIIKSAVFDKNDVQQACGEIDCSIVKYTQRERKRKRKN